MRMSHTSHSVQLPKFTVEAKQKFYYLSIKIKPVKLWSVEKTLRIETPASLGSLYFPASPFAVCCDDYKDTIKAYKLRKTKS